MKKLMDNFYLQPCLRKMFAQNIGKDKLFLYVRMTQGLPYGVTHGIKNQIMEDVKKMKSLKDKIYYNKGMYVRKFFIEGIYNDFLYNLILHLQAKQVCPYEISQAILQEVKERKKK